MGGGFAGDHRLLPRAASSPGLVRRCGGTPVNWVEKEKFPLLLGISPIIAYACGKNHSTDLDIEKGGGEFVNSWIAPVVTSVGNCCKQIGALVVNQGEDIDVLLLQ